jgi:NmrA-like family
MDRVRLVRGDVDDIASLERALVGVDELFANTDFGSTISPLREYEQGVRVLPAAQRSGVERLVFPPCRRTAHRGLLREPAVPVTPASCEAA